MPRRARRSRYEYGTVSVLNWYHRNMPTNLRLRPDLADAVKSEAARTGRSQQDVMRDAIERYLASGGGTSAHTPSVSDILPPRTPWREAAKRIRLPQGTNSLDLLDREDRI